MDRIKVSVIGLRGHAGRHIEWLIRNPRVDLAKVFYHQDPPPDCSHLPVTDSLSDCFSSDLVIISTPTSSHYEFMKALWDYNGYIFLEKPAVNTRNQIQNLLGFPEEFKRRIRVNFNFQFHELGSLLIELIESGRLGRVFALDVHTSHGVAFRKDWSNTWRVENETGLGPLETTGIHYIQFALTRFGECTSREFTTNCLSGRPGAIDTGTVNMHMEDGVSVRIRHSYAAPYAVRFELWGTEGYLVYDGESAILHHPRDTFDIDGRFAKPPITDRWEIEYQEAWTKSLVESQTEFCNIVRNKVALDPAEFDRDVSAMDLILDS